MKRRKDTGEIVLNIVWAILGIITAVIGIVLIPRGIGVWKRPIESIVWKVLNKVGAVLIIMFGVAFLITAAVIIHFFIDDAINSKHIENDNNAIEDIKAKSKK